MLLLRELQSFHSRSGKAFLFNAVSNCIEGRIEERIMTTGESTSSGFYKR